MEGVQEKLEILEDENQYKVKLENFEGPLDLLLHLIKDSELEIEAIRLADITSQYLEFMKDLDKVDMERASDFIEIAATLIEIKSKSVLPRPEEFQFDEEDPETKLKRQIMEYKLFKEAGEKLHTIENVNRMFKEPEDEAKKYKIILKYMVLDNLLDAFTAILHRTQVQIKTTDNAPKQIVKDRFTVAEKIAAIKDAILINKKIMFSELFESDNTRSEVINVFLAVLELLKQQVISIKQEYIYSDIEIVEFNGERYEDNDISEEIESYQSEISDKDAAANFDEYFAKVLRYIIQKEEASVFMIQRKFGLNPLRVENILEKLVESNYISYMDDKGYSKAQIEMKKFNKIFEWNKRKIRSEA